MDTVIELNISARSDVSELFDECEALILSIERSVSVTSETGDIAKLNRDGQALCGDIAVELLSQAREIGYLTDGAFDCTVLPIKEVWADAEDRGTLPTADEIETALSRVSYDNISIDGNGVTLSDGVRLDLGGIAKGYAADKVVALVESRSEEYGITGGLLSFGGAISVFGAKADGSAYRIGLRDPDDASLTVGSIAVEHGHVSVTGDYERYFSIEGKQFCHVLNPKTGYPINGELRSVAVISDDGTLSDGLSTALFVCGYEDGLRLYESGVADFEAVFIFKDGSIKTTAGVSFTAK